jgi:hypothetical protein
MSLEGVMLAKKLNRVFGSFGPEVPGLEQVDIGKLRELESHMGSFLDHMDELAVSNPALAARAGAEGLAAIRQSARLASAAVDGSASAQAYMHAFCGGAFTPPALPPPVLASIPSTPLFADELGFNPLATNFCSTPGINDMLAAGVGCGGIARPMMSSGCGVDPNLQMLECMGGAGGYFEDRVFFLMIKIVEDFQRKIEERLQKLQEQAKEAEKAGGKKKGKGGFMGALGGIVKVAAPIVGSVFGGPVGGMVGNMVGNAVGNKMQGGGSGGSGGNGQTPGSESRNIEFERIKFDMQKLSQMQQALSNILNTMDELAKSAIRHIKAG